MIRWLTGLLGAATERRMGDFLLGVAAAGLVALSAAISLGFGTFAVYAYLRASQGRVVAALIVCAAYGAIAITIWAVGMARRRAHRLRLAAMASAPAPVADINSILQHLVAAGAQQDQSALAAAMRLGRELSPMQLFALALVGGFIAGKKLAK
jgi:hypothetical protein